MFELFTHRAETLLKEWNCCFITAGDRQVEKNHFSQVKKTWKEPLIGLQHPNIWASHLGHTHTHTNIAFLFVLLMNVLLRSMHTLTDCQTAAGGSALSWGLLLPPLRNTSSFTLLIHFFLFCQPSLFLPLFTTFILKKKMCSHFLLGCCLHQRHL